MFFLYVALFFSILVSLIRAVYFWKEALSDEAVTFFGMLTRGTHNFVSGLTGPFVSSLLSDINGSFRVLGDNDSGVRFPCPNRNCGRVFNWKRNLTRHLKYECGVQPRFKCPYCDYYGKLKGNVSKHLIRRHKNRKIFVVDLFQETPWMQFMYTFFVYSKIKKPACKIVNLCDTHARAHRHTHIDTIYIYLLIFEIIMNVSYSKLR